MTCKYLDFRGGAWRRELGFTLIELMITMLVVAILAMIAIPIYEHQVQESRRTEARTALLELAGREERYFATNNTYTSSASSLGYGNNTWPITVGSGYYQLQQPVVAAGPPPSFTLTAKAVGVQTKDTSCQSFSVDSTGQQTSSPDTTCW